MALGTTTAASSSAAAAAASTVSSGSINGQCGTLRQRQNASTASTPSPTMKREAGDFRTAAAAAPTTLGGRLALAVRRRIYLYELTFGLYMLEPWEKALFNSAIAVFLVLFAYACVRFVPLYGAYVATKAQYYLGA